MLLSTKLDDTQISPQQHPTKPRIPGAVCYDLFARRKSRGDMLISLVKTREK